MKLKEFLKMNEATLNRRVKNIIIASLRAIQEIIRNRERGITEAGEIEKAKPKNLTVQQKRELLKKIYKKVLKKHGREQDFPIFAQMIDNSPDDYLDYELQINTEKGADFVEKTLQGVGMITPDEMRNFINVTFGTGFQAIQKGLIEKKPIKPKDYKFAAQQINKNLDEFMSSIEKRKSPVGKLETPKRKQIESKALTIPIEDIPRLRLKLFDFSKNPELAKLVSKLRSKKGTGFTNILSQIFSAAKSYKEAIKAAKKHGIEFTRNEWNRMRRQFNRAKEEAKIRRK